MRTLKSFLTAAVLTFATNNLPLRILRGSLPAFVKKTQRSLPRMLPFVVTTSESLPRITICAKKLTSKRVAMLMCQSKSVILSFV